jgi:hypothetical protein
MVKIKRAILKFINNTDDCPKCMNNYYKFGTRYGKYFCKKCQVRSYVGKYSCTLCQQNISILNLTECITRV